MDSDRDIEFVELIFKSVTKDFVHTFDQAGNQLLRFAWDTLVEQKDASENPQLKPYMDRIEELFKQHSILHS